MSKKIDWALFGCHEPIYPFWPGTAGFVKEWKTDKSPETEKVRKEWNRVFGGNYLEECRRQVEEAAYNATGN